MTPAARLDPSVLTRRDVGDLCDQLKKDPQSNMTSIDRIVVQPAALKRTCNAMNATKGGNRTIEAFGEEWLIERFYHRESPLFVQYSNPCRKNPNDILTEDWIEGEHDFRLLRSKPTESGAFESCSIRETPLRNAFSVLDISLDKTLSPRSVRKNQIDSLQGSYVISSPQMGSQRG